jgi:transcriptional regulator with XRE-family HTH domain
LKLPKLREMRELRGWSQSVLAEKADVSRDSISNYETGHRAAYPSTAKKLADALGVTIADFLEDEAPKAVLTTPLLEWALTASDEDFDRYIKTAPIPETNELMKITSLVPQKPEAARVRVLERVMKIVKRFQEFEGHYWVEPPPTQEEQPKEEAS